MKYVVIYRSAVSVGYRMHESEAEARDDWHLSANGFCGRLYSIDDPDGFTGGEAKDLYNHGIEAMAPGWGIQQLEV